jgi:plastocyanin
MIESACAIPFLEAKNNMTVTSTSGLPSDPNSGSIFDSGTISPNNTFSHTFQNSGTIHYHCMMHPFMTGEVTVS